MPADETQLLYTMCLHGRGELGLAPDEYAALTMVLLRLLAFKPAAPVAQRPPKPPVASVAPGAPPAAEQRMAQSPVDRSEAALPLEPVESTPPGHALPPGQVLPVVMAERLGLGAQGARGSEASYDAAPGQLQTRVLAVPVRVQADSRMEAAAANQVAQTILVPTEEGAFWHATVMQMVAADTINALVRELALQSQLVARDTDQWVLRVERESLNQASARERLAAAMQSQGYAVSLAVEIGRVTDSPARRNAAAAAERQLSAERIIFEDPFVQDMMRDFGAKIVPGSIKPI
jgi:DNA polymerase-3 subunit gamma/tau